MKLKFLLDLVSCDFEVYEKTGRKLYMGNKYNIDGYDPKLKERIVIEIFDGMEFVVEG